MTENVVDFRPLAARELQRGRSHAGVIFTSNRSFPRHDARVIGTLVTTLNELLTKVTDSTGLEHWLS